MNLLRKIWYAKWNSAFIRKMLGLYFKEGRIYTVFFGPLAGAKIGYDPSINFHAVLGLWELESFELLRKVFKILKAERRGMVIADVGANIGSYSLWFSRQLPSHGTVYAFEPSPGVAVKLRKNMELNKITNVEVVEAACSDKAGQVTFFIAAHHHSSSLHQKWASGGQIVPQEITVSATTMDEFFCGQTPREGPDFIKMDIEGGGTFALKGCDRCVAAKRPLFLIESHMPAEDAAIRDMVLRHDYQAYRLDDRQWVKALTQTHPNPQGIWGTLFVCPSEMRSSLARVLK